MKPRLMNYTTSIPASRSIAEIQEMLISFGATSIVMDAPDKRVNALRFIFPLDGKPIPFSLPVDISKTASVLWVEYHNKTPKGKKTKDEMRDDAERIAWRILRDWVHAQLSILTIEAAVFIDVFAGYLVTDMATCETLGHRLANGNIDRLLPEVTR